MIIKGRGGVGNFYDRHSCHSLLHQGSHHMKFKIFTFSSEDKAEKFVEKMISRHEVINVSASINRYFIPPQHSTDGGTHVLEIDISILYREK